MVPNPAAPFAFPAVWGSGGCAVFVGGDDVKFYASAPAALPGFGNHASAPGSGHSERFPGIRLLMSQILRLRPAGVSQTRCSQPRQFRADGLKVTPGTPGKRCA